MVNKTLNKFKNRFVKRTTDEKRMGSEKTRTEEKKTKMKKKTKLISARSILLVFREGEGVNGEGKSIRNIAATVKCLSACLRTGRDGEAANEEESEKRRLDVYRWRSYDGIPTGSYLIICAETYIYIYM